MIALMLPELDLLNNLRQFGWLNNNPLCIYWDPAYPVSFMYLLGYSLSREFYAFIGIQPIL